MPFKSKSQAKMMFAQHPEMAKEWMAETPSLKNLPMHVGDAKGRNMKMKRKMKKKIKPKMKPKMKVKKMMMTKEGEE